MEGGFHKRERPLFMSLTHAKICGIRREQGTVSHKTPKKWGKHMSLSRKFLEGLDLDEKKISAIVEGNAESLKGVIAERDKAIEERDKALEEAKKVADLQKQLEELRANSGSDWKTKAEEAQKALEDYKSKVESEKAEASKAQAYRGMLQKAGIDPKRIDSIMRVTDLSEVTMKDGALEESEKLEEAAKKEWSDFLLKETTIGAKPATPPSTTGSANEADPDVLKYLQARHERLHGKAE